MTFGESIKTCFSNYATFSGRASRSEFWWFYLFTVLGSTITCGIASVVFIIPSLAVSVRRLHDIGKSGWLYLLAFIPLLNLLLIYFWICESQQGDNSYGPQPK